MGGASEACGTDDVRINGEEWFDALGYSVTQISGGRYSRGEVDEM